MASNDKNLRQFKPPAKTPHDLGRIRIFLGGSIEMGGARDWQKTLVDHLAASVYGGRIDVYNPRRDDWDSSWPNDANHRAFKEQVDWELEHQKSADLIIYYFAGQTVSPITLLELGLFHDRHPVIGADPDYKRLGNLMVTKDHFAMDIHVGWEAFIKALDRRLQEQVSPANKAGLKSTGPDGP